jgi:hypothetical protein
LRAVWRLRRGPWPAAARGARAGSLRLEVLAGNSPRAAFCCRHEKTSRRPFPCVRGLLRATHKSSACARLLFKMCAVWLLFGHIGGPTTAAPSAAVAARDRHSVLQRKGTAGSAHGAEKGVRFLPRPVKRLPFLRRGRAKRLLLRPAAPFITRGLLITKYYGVIFYESVVASGQGRGRTNLVAHMTGSNHPSGSMTRVDGHQMRALSRPSETFRRHVNVTAHGDRLIWARRPATA